MGNLYHAAFEFVLLMCKNIPLKKFFWALMTITDNPLLWVMLYKFLKMIIMANVKNILVASAVLSKYHTE
jgi:hypothetical protein